MNAKTLLLVYLLALVVRLAWVGVFRDVGLGLDDMFQYDMLGRSLAEGNGFRWYKPADLAPLASVVGLDLTTVHVPPQGLETTFRAPLYPAFLAVIYYFAGPDDRLLAARLVQAFVVATLAPLTVLLARRLRVPAKGSLIGGLILALYPVLTLYPLALVTEILFLPLTAVAALLILRAAESGRRRDFFQVGLALGLAALTRSIAAAFLPVSLLAMPRRSGPGRRGPLLALVAFAAITLPWASRNTLLAGAPTFVETSGGYNLFIGYHPAGNGTFLTEVAIVPLRIIDDGERDRWTTKQAIEFIKSAPGRVPRLILDKWRYFWGLEKRALIYFYSNGFFGELPPALLVSAFLVFTLPLVLVVTLAIAGMVCAPVPAQTRLVFLLGGTYVLVHLLIMAEDRFHLALLPFLAAYAGYALADWRAVLMRLRNERRKLLLVVILIAVFLLGWGVEIVADWPKLLVLLAPGGSQAYFNY